jgi:hypothetical protein
MPLGITAFATTDSDVERKQLRILQHVEKNWLRRPDSLVWSCQNVVSSNVFLHRNTTLKKTKLPTAVKCACGTSPNVRYVS